MGSGQSARKLTISNDYDTVVKISSDLADRLVKNGELMKLEKPNVTTITTGGITEPPPSPSLPQSGDASAGQPTILYSGLTVSAFEIQKQKEQELINAEKYWQKRMQNLESSYQNINRILDEEHKRAIREFSPSDTGKNRPDIYSRTQPCLENSEKVLKCYQQYPKESLKCSSLVEEFSNCVDQRRSHVITARC